MTRLLLVALLLWPAAARAQSTWSLASPDGRTSTSVSRDAAGRLAWQVPAAWDETHALEGEPGRDMVIARRDGAAWYVAGINGQDVPRTITLKPAFLKDASWKGTLVRDGVDDRQLTSETVELEPKGAVTITMRPRGGFAIRLQRADTLDIYFLDVEGGQATLFVTPSGESMLIDTGYPGNDDRDVNRVMAAIKQTGLSRLDYLLVTHYHADHVGNAPAIAARIPVGAFIDHGETVETDENAKALYDAYVKARASGRHVLARPGHKLPMRDLDVTIVAARGETIARALTGAGAPNPLCAAFTPKEEDPTENAQSVGTVIAFGRFEMVDLGDLTWNKEHELACPNNLLGTADVYLTTHHGLARSGPAAIVHALHPRVAVMNNGPRKGGAAEAWQIVRESPGLQDVWQLHYAVDAGPDRNAPDAMIANPDESTAYAIRVSAHRDGSFSVTNTRTGLTKQYAAAPVR